MAIGERIRFFRGLRRMTQKQLGMAVGFPEQSADVRIAQYESAARAPKAELTRALARALDVSPQALAVPDIDSETGLMHTLFALEDIYGLTVGELEGEVCLRLDRSRGTACGAVPELLASWREEARKLEAGEISREEYDRWRYGCPPQAEPPVPAPEEPELNPEPELVPAPELKLEPEPEPESKPELEQTPEPAPKPASPAQDSGNKLAEILKRYII